MSYLSLPREIRDMIMKLALHHGVVRIHTTSQISKNDSFYFDKQPCYGVQMLATCHQIYEEGHRIWYGRNMFYLPSCPSSEMARILGFYQRKHLGMMRRLMVDLTIRDVPGDILARIVTGVTKNYSTWLRGQSLKSELKHRPSIIEGDFANELCVAMKREWQAKIRWLRNAVPHGDRLHAVNYVGVHSSMTFNTRKLSWGVNVSWTKITIVMGPGVRTLVDEQEIRRFMGKCLEEIVVAARLTS